MSNETIRELVGKLHDAMRTADIDAQTRSLLKQFDAEIHEYLESSQQEGEENSVLERSKELETRFATSHPAAERFIREIIDTLARMGV